eukprot:358130-Chlamydomonas_euryale.AAC.2
MAHNAPRHACIHARTRSNAAELREEEGGWWFRGRRQMESTYEPEHGRRPPRWYPTGSQQWRILRRIGAPPCATPRRHAVEAASRRGQGAAGRAYGSEVEERRALAKRAGLLGMPQGLTSTAMQATSTSKTPVQQRQGQYKEA